MPLRAKQPKKAALTFFVDECLKCSLIREALDRALLPREKVEVAVKGTLDEDWLPRAGRCRWVCFSKDRRMTTRPNELRAIVDHEVGLVMLENATGAEHAALIVAALPLIRRAANVLPRAFIVRIDGGDLTVLYEDGEKLKRSRIMKRTDSERRAATP